MKTRQIENLPVIRNHIRQARAAGQCEQCQHPWWDGMCSCGKYGDEEERILDIVWPILNQEANEASKKMAIRTKLEIKRFDDSLKPVKELQELWKRD